ncbi:MAG: FAD-binding oxidoreductase [Candidatus Pacearchaeota archaeon]
MIKLKINNIKEENYNTKTFFLEKPENFSFIPGQHVELKIPKKDEIKPFTLSSIPQDNFISLTIKNVSENTEKIFELKEGDFLEINGPFGEKLKFNQDKNKLLYFAAGSGITPFISHFRFIKNEKLKKEAILFYSNKTFEDIIFFKELKSFDFLKTIFILTREKKEGFYYGYLTKEIITNTIKNKIDIYKIYVCGTEKFEKSVIELLESI